MVCELTEATWPAYEALIERHNGVWGGCWCMGFHEIPIESKLSKRERKKGLVCEGRAHTALVMEGDVAVGWCQFGPNRELKPQNKFKRKYESEQTIEPDWKITCFFVDKSYRGRGVSSLALDGALKFIAGEGGGLVEAYPESVDGRKVQSTFICLGTIPMFEKRGFVKTRQVAMHHWVMTKEVAPLSTEPESCRVP